MQFLQCLVPEQTVYKKTNFGKSTLARSCPCSKGSGSNNERNDGLWRVESACQAHSAELREQVVED